MLLRYLSTPLCTPHKLGDIFGKYDMGAWASGCLQGASWAKGWCKEGDSCSLGMWKHETQLLGSPLGENCA